MDLITSSIFCLIKKLIGFSGVVQLDGLVIDEIPKAHGQFCAREKKVFVRPEVLVGCAKFFCISQ
jgi:hypothetical protein